MIETDYYKLALTFQTPLLATQPSVNRMLDLAQQNKHLFTDDEIEELGLIEETGMTSFIRTPENEPALFNYQILGFLKEAGRALNGINDVRNLRWKVSTYISVSPRFIKLNLPGDEKVSQYTRPLRGETARGGIRMVIATSELVPPETFLVCNLEVIRKSGINEETLKDLLDFGYTKGLGQWRSSGAFGSFIYKLESQ